MLKIGMCVGCMKLTSVDTIQGQKVEGQGSKVK